MSSISSLSAAVSALMSSQAALNTTAHNLANVNTPGYVRQQVLMKDARYAITGQNATTRFYVGNGVDLQAVRQVRDRFLDQSFRQENARQAFYTAQSSSIEEIETILGETEGESFGKVLNELWVSLNELSKSPEGLETRGAFVQNVVLFTNRANLIMDQLNGYQENMNNQVIDTINKINAIGEEINNLNAVIVRQELSGGNANDYRDQRNNLLDKLSGMVDISYREDTSGNTLVSIEGTEFVTLGSANKMGIAAAAPFSPLVKPIWPHLNGASNDVYNLNEEISPEYNNDKGSLKGLLLARGTKPANYTDMQNHSIYESQIKPSVIMNAQAQFDTLIHRVVTLINDTLAPKVQAADSPVGLDGSQHIEMFVRKGMARYDGAGNFITEDVANPYTLYTASNIEINPEILGDYNKLCLSKTAGTISDNSIVQKIIDEWKVPFAPIEPVEPPGIPALLDINSYYTDFISGIGNVGNATNSKMTNQELMTMQIDNQRSSHMGVSSDEELSNMIKFQHAYNAAAKVVSILDQMMEQVVKSTGLVGR